MHTIEATDIVWASATYRGRTVAAFSSTGFTSLADVVRAVRLAVGTLAGSLRLTLRNASRGWTQTRSLFMAPLPAGTQLTLF